MISYNNRRNSSKAISNNRRVRIPSTRKGAPVKTPVYVPARIPKKR